MMKNKKTKRNIRATFYLAVVILLTIGVGAISYANLSLSSQVLKEQIFNASDKSLENISTAFQARIDQIEDDLAGIYSERELLRLLSGGTDYAELRNEYAGFARSFATQAFETQLKVDALYLYTMDHRCISYYRRADTPTYRYPTDIYEEGSDGTDYNGKTVKTYIDSDRTAMLVSGYYNPYRDRNIIRFVYKIFVDNRREVAGYLICDTDEQAFQRFIGELTYYTEQIIYAQAVGDRVLLQFGTPEERQQAILTNVSEQIAGLPYQAARRVTAEDITADNTGASGNIFVTSIPRYGLVFYSMLPESMLRESSRSLMFIVITLSIIVVIALILFSFLFGSYFTAQYERSRADAEFRALQAQINPHFLYNTLETMIGVARRNNCPEVGDLCRALAMVFRYSMDTSEDTVTLQREIEHIRNYLFVMTTRMNNEAEVTISVDPAYMQARLPKMSLQPIVENALKHGLSGVRGEKRLSIYAKEIEGRLHVIVRDNGAGTDAEALNKALRAGIEFSEDKTSIGILNVHKRIRFVCGRDCGLYMESKPGDTKAHLILGGITR